MNSWTCGRCHTPNWQDYRHCRNCGTPKGGAPNKFPRLGREKRQQPFLVFGNGNAGRRAFSEERVPPKGGGKGGRPVGGPPEILPAPPSIAQGHSAFLHPPMEPEARERHIATIKSRLRLLVQARDMGQLAGKAEDHGDVAEIACLKHMVFVATTPPTSQVSATQKQLLTLEKQLMEAEEL